MVSPICPYESISILDAAWGSFTQILEAVAVKCGNWIVKVNPYGTSQRCSGCDKNVPKALSVRTHRNTRYAGNSEASALSREATRATLVAVVFVLQY